MTKNKYTNLLLQTLGCFISAAGIYSFAVAAEVPVTGIAGICAILYRLFGIPMGLSNVLINIPIILCTYKLLGRSFFIRSVYCMVLFAIFTDYLLPLMPVYQGDRLLATICGGVVGGIGGRADLHEQLEHRRLELHHHGHQGTASAPAVRQHHVFGGAGGHPAQRCGVPGCRFHYLRYHV